MSDYVYVPSARSKFLTDLGLYATFNISSPNHKPDVYWNPHVGDWRYLDPSQYGIATQGLPSTGPIDAGDFSAPEKVFDQITEQYIHLPSEIQPNAVWGGKQNGWGVPVLLTTGPSTSPGDLKKIARKEYEDRLAYLNHLRDTGQIETPEPYNTLVNNLTQQYRDRI